MAEKKYVVKAGRSVSTKDGVFETGTPVKASNIAGKTPEASISNFDLLVKSEKSPVIEESKYLKTDDAEFRAPDENKELEKKVKVIKEKSKSPGTVKPPGR